MINRFLSAKHWQLFLVIIGIPFTMNKGVEYQLYELVETNGLGLKPEPLNQYILLFLFFYNLLAVCLLIGWFRSVIIGLKAKIPENAKIRVAKLRTTLYIPIGLLMFILLIISTNSDPVVFDKLQIVAFLFGLSLIACVLYWLYMTAKTIKTAECQLDVSFSDFAGEFFLLVFWPVGIWIIQPRINALVFDKPKTEDPS